MRWMMFIVVDLDSGYVFAIIDYHFHQSVDEDIHG